MWDLSVNVGKPEVSGRRGKGQFRAHAGSWRGRGELRAPVCVKVVVQKPHPVQMRGGPFGDLVPEVSSPDSEAQRCVTGVDAGGGGWYTVF